MKKAPAAKKQPLASKKNAPNDSVSDVDESDFAATPVKTGGKSKAPGSAGNSDVENSPVVKTAGKGKSASEMYQKVPTTSPKIGIGS